MGFVGLSSCTKALDITNVQKDDISLKLNSKPDYLIPLAKADATISEVLMGNKIGNGYIIKSGDELKLHYEVENTLKYRFVDFFKSKVEDHKSEVKYPKNGYSISGSFTPKQFELLIPQIWPKEEESLEFDLPEEVTEVNKFQFSGSLIVRVTEVPVNLNLKLSFLEVKDNKGNNYSVNLPCERNKVSQKEFDLSNLLYTGTNLTNKLKLTYELNTEVRNDASNIDIVAGKGLKIELISRNVDVKLFDGKTKPYIKDIEKIADKPNFTLFDDAKGLELYDSHLALKLNARHLVGNALFKPKFIVQGGSEFSLDEKEAKFNSLKGVSSDALKYQGDKVASVLNEFLHNKLDTDGQIIINPNGERIAFDQDTELDANIVFEQDLAFKLKDYSFEIVSGEVNIKSYDDILRESFDNYALALYTESDIPLQVSFDDIEILDKDKENVKHTISCKGILKGSKQTIANKSKIVCQITKEDVDKLLETEDACLRFKGHIASLNKERVLLKANQSLKIQLIIGLNHQF